MQRCEYSDCILMRLFTHTQKKNEIKKELDVGLHHPVRL